VRSYIAWAARSKAASVAGKNYTPVPALACMAKVFLVLIAVALAVLIGAFVFAAFTL
jgi:hypothetical protein